MTCLPRGAFILLEGVDRCGKTTQSQKLLDYLVAKGRSAELWRFPDRLSPSTGPLINSYLKKDVELNDAAIHLIFSSNRWEKQEQMLQKLLSGTNLVVDRYAFSGVAYSAAKERPGMGLGWCRQPDVGLPAPDLVIYLQMPEDAASQRDGFGEERYEKAEFQAKVKRCFSALQDDSWFVVDASQTIEDIHQQIAARVEAVLQQCQQGPPVKKLWLEEQA